MPEKTNIENKWGDEIGFFGLCVECKDDEYKLEGYNLAKGFVCEDCYKKLERKTNG